MLRGFFAEGTKKGGAVEMTTPPSINYSVFERSRKVGISAESVWLISCHIGIAAAGARLVVVLYYYFLEGAALVGVQIFP